MKKKYLASVLFVVFFLLIAFGLVLFSPIIGKDYHTDLSGCAEADITYADGTTAHVEGTEFGPINKGDRISVEVALPESMKKDPGTMVFAINHIVGKIYYHDTLLTSYGEDIAERGDFVCHHIYMTNIPGEAWGDSIRIEMLATENKAFNRIAKLYLYPSEQAYHFYFDLEYARFWVALSIMIISVVMFVVILVVFLRKRERQLSLLSLAVFGLISSMWMALAEGFQGILGIDSYILTTLEYVFLVAQAIPIGFYTILDEHRRWVKSLLYGLIAFDMGYLIVISILNYSNIAHFSVAVQFSVGVVALNGVIFVVQVIRHYDKTVLSRRITLMGCLLLCFSGFFDMSRFTLYRSTGLKIFNKTQQTFPQGVLVFFVLLLAAILVKDKESQERERHQMAKVMTSQIQPHFLYNALSSIREMIYIDPDYAADVLASFTIYLRGAVRAMSDVTLVPFSEELNNIKAYTDIERMRFSDRLEVVYEIESDDFMIPPISIQPIVENAIKHGIYNRGSAGGRVVIKTEETDTSWIVRINDNGVGFDVNKVRQEIRQHKRDSVGITNLMSRLRDVLQADVAICSLIGVGTDVTVTIPKNASQREKKAKLLSFRRKNSKIER